MKYFVRHFFVTFFWICIVVVAPAQTIVYQTIIPELESLKQEFVPDPSLAVLNIELKDTAQSIIVLSGETNLPDAKEQIIMFLREKKVPFADSLRLLPDQSLGTKIWALATLSVSNLRSSPRHASELVSQVMMGTPLKVLDKKGNWYLIQTPEYYIGWMDNVGLQILTQQELDRWKQSERFVYCSLTGFVYGNPGKEDEIISDIVLGDIFEVEPENSSYLKIRMPDGRRGYVRESECISFTDWCNTQSNGQDVISIARQMMGSPYLWGGTSSKAVDCSGFVKLVYYALGIILTRDASQQLKYGDPVDFADADNLQPGDLLFFGSSISDVGHVGICLGKQEFIHASGRVQTGSIDPHSPNFVADRKMVAAVRVLGSSDSKGIVRVKDHPWYFIKH